MSRYSGNITLATGSSNTRGGDVSLKAGAATGEHKGSTNKDATAKGGSVSIAAGSGSTMVGHGSHVELRAGLGKASLGDKAASVGELALLKSPKQSAAVAAGALSYGAQDGSISLLAANGAKRIVANTSSVAVSALRVKVDADSTAMFRAANELSVGANGSSLHFSHEHGARLAVTGNLAIRAGRTNLAARKGGDVTILAGGSFRSNSSSSSSTSSSGSGSGGNDFTGGGVLLKAGSGSGGGSGGDLSMNSEGATRAAAKCSCRRGP